MYSRKENEMANKHDSFDMDKWSKGRTKTEKKEKDSSPEFKEKEFNMKDSASFEIKERHYKEPKQAKEGGFDISSLFKFGKKNEEGDFKALDDPSEKKFKFDLKNKMTRLTLIISLIVILIVGVSIFAGVFISNVNNEVVSIFISTPPTKNIFFEGDNPDYSGLQIGLLKNNGETEIIVYTPNDSSITVFGFDSSNQVDNQRIIVSYEGLSAYFFIDVIEKPKATPILKNITLEKLPKTEYKLGERLNTTNGVILCEYSDGTVTRVNLTNEDVSGFSKIDGPGEYVLTVKYKKNGVLATTTYTITVTE